ncbi:MAG: hypothetical protein PHD87_04205 [Candidatus Cloacimonetes bacterium]|jgi:hypothetical protein|nr:hypothetical protein [Candidatus Cloacimonadota bacterium]MDD4223767.1 hypothetical protein [Candidatus Cloacimonadota bacterium]
MFSHQWRILRFVFLVVSFLEIYICLAYADGYYDETGSLVECNIELVANDYLIFSKMVKDDYGKWVEVTNIVMACNITSFFHESDRQELFIFPLSGEELMRVKTKMQYLDRDYIQNVGLYITVGFGSGQGFQSSYDINEFFDIPGVEFGRGVWHWDLVGCFGYRNIAQVEGRFSYRNSRMKYEGETVVGMRHTSWQAMARINPNITNWGFRRKPFDVYLVYGIGRSPGYMIPELDAGFVDGKVNTYGLYIGGPSAELIDEVNTGNSFLILLGGFSLEYEKVTYRKIDYSDGGIGDLAKPISVGCLKFLLNFQLGGKIF